LTRLRLGYASLDVPQTSSQKLYLIAPKGKECQVVSCSPDNLNNVRDRCTWLS
jgi:hypothetical protein